MTIRTTCSSLTLSSCRPPEPLRSPDHHRGRLGRHHRQQRIELTEGRARAPARYGATQILRIVLGIRPEDLPMASDATAAANSSTLVGGGWSSSRRSAQTGSSTSRSTPSTWRSKAPSKMTTPPSRQVSSTGPGRRPDRTTFRGRNRRPGAPLGQSDPTPLL